MTKWMVRLVPLTVLIATTAVAAPIWVRNGNETEVRGRVTDVDSTGTQVVIEDRDRVTIAPTAQVAMADVRPGEVVDARYTDVGGQKTIVSMYPVFHEIQAP
jgi:predicted RNA-binding protein (virulence factor B family)